MKRIMIVEDDKTIAEELLFLLNNSDYEGIILKDFENSKKEILDNNPDLILLDINIPYLNGELLLKEIRKESNIPVIMVTSKESEADEVISYLILGLVCLPFSTAIFTSAPTPFWSILANGSCS